MEICAQKLKRDAASDGEPQSSALDLFVTPITKEQADAFILKYEHLGTIGHPQARYGAVCGIDDRLAAVATFGGPLYRTPGQIVLERGACAPWAHPHTASWFLPRACRRAFEDHGWRVFKAYADPAAAEIGTVYQAANWRYVGQGIGRGTIGGEPRPREYFRDHHGRISERGYRKKGLALPDADLLGYVREYEPAKHVYIWIEDHGLSRRERRELWAAQLPALPYPKRVNADAILFISI